MMRLMEQPTHGHAGEELLHYRNDGGGPFPSGSHLHHLRQAVMSLERQDLPVSCPPPLQSQQQDLYYLPHPVQHQEAAGHHSGLPQQISPGTARIRHTEQAIYDKIRREAELPTSESGPVAPLSSNPGDAPKGGSGQERQTDIPDRYPHTATHNLSHDEQREFPNSHKQRDLRLPEYTDSHRPRDVRQPEFPDSTRLREVPQPDYTRNQRSMEMTQPDSHSATQPEFPSSHRLGDITHPEFPGSHRQREIPQPEFPGSHRPREIPQPEFLGNHRPREIPQPEFPGSHRPREIPQPEFPGSHRPQEMPQPEFPGCHRPREMPQPEFPGSHRQREMPQPEFPGSHRQREMPQPEFSDNLPKAGKMPQADFTNSQRPREIPQVEFPDSHRHREIPQTDILNGQRPNEVPQQELSANRRSVDSQQDLTGGQRTRDMQQQPDGAGVPRATDELVQSEFPGVHRSQVDPEFAEENKTNQTNATPPVLNIEPRLSTDSNASTDNVDSHSPHAPTDSQGGENGEEKDDVMIASENRLPLLQIKQEVINKTEDECKYSQDTPKLSDGPPQISPKVEQLSAGEQGETTPSPVGGEGISEPGSTARDGPNLSTPETPQQQTSPSSSNSPPAGFSASWAGHGNNVPPPLMSTPGGSVFPNAGPNNTYFQDSNSNASNSPTGMPSGFFASSDIGKHGDYFYCHLCTFVGTSKDDFNLHMNSHFEHSCPNCDYSSRTEGRLKRHIKDFHGDNPPETYAGDRSSEPLQVKPDPSTPGRPKLFRCRQCEFVSPTKHDFWDHARKHIKSDKVLQCPKCPFVTEYKHHLEYHLRNHFGSKPFKCNKCNYACVNKSMLNSHMKSHTNVYQYRCADCTYATKYCHSLKLHLKKYAHKPATVLNSDGSLPTDGSGDFDLVSKRGPPRGPRGPRKDQSPPPGMSPGMSPGMMIGPGGLPIPGHPSPMNGGLFNHSFWPMNGLQPPPPLIPVSGGGMNTPLSIHMPQDAMVAAAAAAAAAAAIKGPAAPPTSDGRTENFSIQAFKCNFCDFSADSRQAFNQHMVKVHAAENQDLMNVFGLSPDLLAAGFRGGDNGALEREPQPPSKDLLHAWAMLQNMSQAGGVLPPHLQAQQHLLHQHLQQQQHKLQMHQHQQHQKHLHQQRQEQQRQEEEQQQRSSSENPDQGSSRKEQRSSSGESYPGPKREGAAPLDLTKPRDDEDDQNSCSSPSLKRHAEHSVEDAQSGRVSPVPRKRSRKGKAYKLDTLCMKLQDRYGSDDADYASNDEYSEYSPNNPDGDSNGLPGNGQSNGLDRNAECDESNTDKPQSESNVDYSDIFNKLRELNGTLNTETSGNSDKVPSGDYMENHSGSDQSENEAEQSSSTIKHQAVARRIEFTGDKRSLGSNGVENSSSRSEKQAAESRNYECTHCDIAFRDCIMYTMHMGYHGYQDPFKCNMCGSQSKDKVEFFLHIARTAHQ